MLEPIAADLVILLGCGLPSCPSTQVDWERPYLGPVRSCGWRLLPLGWFFIGQASLHLLLESVLGVLKC